MTFRMIVFLIEFSALNDRVQVRALACPAVATLTVCEGACRGAGDLRTPVMVGLFAGVLNAVLDPLLMFPGTHICKLERCKSLLQSPLMSLFKDQTLVSK